ncbi:unnamed protein product [Strongylus vulgaris]|uniref:Uncharacterized protein n=1 Tax=Strongylus vulgaris TaxID=40348 RepID=A0A3P7JGV1_STRVU|nr:unnamed protein product [Strongylus vulgaris]
MQEGLPTLPPLHPVTLPEFLRLPLDADRCIPKLKKQFKENDTYFEDFRRQVDQNNIAAAYDVIYAKAGDICTAEQVKRLKAMDKKYEKMQKSIEELAPEYPKETKDEIMQWLRDDNMIALSGFVTRESMANVFNPAKNSKLMQISVLLGAMQFDQLINPI